MAAGPIMKIIGLTGNAGSGKSTALNFFTSQGIDGISVDAINTELRQHCPHLTVTLERMLGATLTGSNNLIDTRLLAQLIFSSDKARKTVEDYLHPLIMENLQLQLSVLAENNYCIVEIPLLFEAQLLATIDMVVLLTANREILVSRLTTRPAVSRDDADAILEKQLADIDKFQYSSDIVLNNDSQGALLQYLQKIHHRYS